eukprot:scaffold42712_cov176-Amphora_coffeaeformis.AAC.2
MQNCRNPFMRGSERCIVFQTAANGSRNALGEREKENKLVHGSIGGHGGLEHVHNWWRRIYHFSGIDLQRTQVTRLEEARHQGPNIWGHQSDVQK